ncbi:putative tubulin-specific chaperone [Phaeomoniella chlamydospora]|uniref:Putative tubulin-specific chaperone n=1 Tax=Phaeomoniella chlamydospora TaxID=158046 RepID=A0A0G2H8N8_PHACM|nr:putative tubulin-specific chaperone [Phaeomoniella chlamydospora]
MKVLGQPGLEHLDIDIKYVEFGVMDEFHIGQRLSYDGALCTVRYHGQVEGTKGEWLGVEWDDSSRGKHSGQYQGKIYFQCLSRSPTSASFIRPTRPHDEPRTFLEALRFKYAPDSLSREGSNTTKDETKPVTISGKVAEEVGFGRIWKQLSMLEELKIVLLDGLRIRGVSNDLSAAATKQAQSEITTVCPKIQELDLGRNMLEDWDDVANICRPLKNLKVLRIGGNQLKPLLYPRHFPGISPFKNVKELYLDDTLMTWEEITKIANTEAFPNLRLLSASCNQLIVLTIEHRTSHPGIESITIDANHFHDLEDLLFLSEAYPNLKELSVQDNQVIQVWRNGQRRNKPLLQSLQTLNLARNAIDDWSFVTDLTFAFPKLVSLRISNNPLYAAPEAHADADMPLSAKKSAEETFYMLTLARFPNLKILNYSAITSQDRLNGELYYLSSIEREIQSSFQGGQPLSQEALAERHPRYHELCKIYDRDPLDIQIMGREGIPQVIAPDVPHALPASLAARLVTIELVKHGQDPSQPKPIPEVVLTVEVPKTMSTYSLKGFVTRKLGLLPLSFRLIYESAELDPVAETVVAGHTGEAGDDDDVEWDVDPTSEVDKNGSLKSKAVANEHMTITDHEQSHIEFEGKKWKKREVEMLDSTREIGSWFDDKATKAIVRIEPRHQTDKSLR